MRYRKMAAGLFQHWPAVAATLSVLLLWEAAIVIFRVPEYVVPRPSAVLVTTWIKFPMLWSHGVVTGLEVLVGFGLSILIGIPLGVAIVYSRHVERALYPLLVASQTIPKVAIAPMLVMWFGFGFAPKVIVALLVAFFPVVVNTVIGLSATESEIIYLARSTGATAWQTFTTFRLPRALPALFGGLKISISLAVVGAVVGEFVGADEGLGYVLMVANGNLDSRTLFAAVLVLTLEGILLNGILDMVEKAAIPWERAKLARLNDGL